MKKSLKSHALVAGAATAGLAGSGHAATVQITLTGNQITAGVGNQLNADVTGDTIPDITITGAATSFGASQKASAMINGGLVYGRYRGRSASYLDQDFAPGAIGAVIFPETLNPITFTDSRINGGAPTNGYLGVGANANTASVRLTRLVFDNASTARPTGVSHAISHPEFVPVPEVSSLGLLALGAGGLMLRRERKKSA